MSASILEEDLGSPTVGNDTVDGLIPAGRTTLHQTVNSVIALLAVLGNGLVIFVMSARRQKFKSFTNRLILHQSVVDLVGGVSFFLHHVVKSPVVRVSMEGTLYDQLVCRFLFADFFLWCTNVTSTYNLVMISLERFMATCHPVKYRNTWSPGKVKLAILAAWGVGIFCSSHLMIIIEAYKGRCIYKDIGFGLYIIISTAVLAIEFFIPLIIMSCSYIKILIMLTRKIANPVGDRQNTLPKAKKNVLVTVLLVVVMFVICWTPSECMYMAGLITGTPSDVSTYVILTTALACNIFVNPVIYCLKYDQFRAQLKDILGNKLCTAQVEDDHSVQS